MAEALHNVRFQAARTNSSSPPSGLPFNIEQALRGDVGTTRLPSHLSSVSQFFLYLAAMAQFAGVLWILWKWPIIAVLLAVCVAGITLSLAGLFHSLPYLNVRRSLWSLDNRRLLWGCSVISWAAWAAIAYFLVFYQPILPAFDFHKFQDAITSRGSTAAIEKIRSNLQMASNHCIYDGDPVYCRWQAKLSVQLASARREAEAKTPRETPKEELPVFQPEGLEDYFRKLAVWFAAILVLGAITRLITCGSSFGSEVNSAIWREPHTGYPGNPTSFPPQGAPDDSAEKLKKKGFDRWLKDNISLSGDTSTAVDAVYGDYRKYLDNPEKHITSPPAYNLSEFKIAFKSATGREPIENKYQGVSFANGGLI